MLHPSEPHASLDFLLMDLHYDILDSRRKDVLPLFQTITDWGYYLAGGTALALVLGHRDSIDFDFFTPEPIDTALLYKKCEELFLGHTLLRTQEEPNTLGLLIDNEIRLSFMTYAYPMVNSQTLTEYFSLASLEDIGCMKMSAITSRNVYKDYVDLYFILQLITLKTLIDALRIKMPTLDPLLALKSLVYFDDIKEEGIMYKTDPIPFQAIKETLLNKVKEYNQTI